MAGEVLQVRAKPFRRKPRLSMPSARSMAALAAGLVMLLVACEVYSGTFGIITTHFETIQNGATKTIKVPPGGNLQAAIDQASGGDVVELQAGAVYSGQINLSNRPLTDYVTIQTSAVAMLPADKRVIP